MNVQGLGKAIKKISRKIETNKDYLVKLDQQNGDGDFGISMNDGFKAVDMLLELSEEEDLGKILMKSGNAFNEAAPSSLGTILSFGFMGMAKSLKGKSEAGPAEIMDAFQAGINKIMEKAGSKPGERTILDSLYPAVKACEKTIAEGGTMDIALKNAAKAAAEGAEATKQMKPVHGRAAYYGEKSLGYMDGGAAVGQLIFDALSE